MVMPKLNSNIKLYTIAVIGAILSIFGTTILFTWKSLFIHLLHNQMQITPGSRTFALWRDTPVPMYINFYFHNWTNPHELNTNKPKFNQLGPYRFNVEERKTNITNNANGTITFRIMRKWYFDPENSNGSLDDIVTTLNAVAMSAASTSKDWSVFLTGPLAMTIRNTGQKIFIQKKAGDLLFFGYNDPLIAIANQIPSFIGVEVPPFDKFAWFYKRNESSDFEGVLNMDTGENGIHNLGKLHNWNYDNITNFYDEPCSMVNGSAGELFPPNQSKEKGIEFFTADLCRSITLPFQSETEVHGIRGYKYTATEYTFDNGTHNPDNLCFCNGQCSPSGVLNVTSCRYGAPGFISFPHYHLADQFYLDQVDGMKPDAEKHTLYITLEPETGIPLDVAARFQVNILLYPINKISLFKDVPTIYFPMLWFEQRATITRGLAWQVKIALAGPLIGQIFSILFIFCGLSMALYSIYFIISLNKSSKETKINMINLKKEEAVVKPLIKSNELQVLTREDRLVPQKKMNGASERL